jgi:adenylosuccinate synthase
MDKLKICVAYKYNGNTTEHFPKEIDAVQNCEPVYIELDGWEESTLGAKSLDSLPENAKNYIRKIEELTGVSIDIISTGQKRDEIIVLKEQL